MSRSARTPVVPLHTLAAGQAADCFAVLASKQPGTTRDGKPFFTCHFKDRRRSVSFMAWADSPWFTVCRDEWKEGQAYKLRVTLGEHDKYGPQIELHQIRPVNPDDAQDGFDVAQLVEASRWPGAALLQALLTLAEQEIVRPPLRTLVVGLLRIHGPALVQLPASENRYYPFPGGWLEHTLSVTKTCLLLADHYHAHYPEDVACLDRDLLLAGALLHEIGRAVELRCDTATSPAQPTVAGRLFGHLLLARDLVRDAALAQGDVPPDLRQRLEHLILTHLALPEWGSPRLPMLPEVLILHHADDLDAKLEMYLRCLRRDTLAGPFTARDPILGKPLLKPGPWEPPAPA
jgi:3'-5' exoribonuclease